MPWRGDALAAVSAGRSDRGVRVMQPGLLGAAHSLINKAADPTAPSISPVSAPGVVGLLHLIPSSALWGSKFRSCHSRATQLQSVLVGNQIATAFLPGEPSLRM